MAAKKFPLKGAGVRGDNGSGKEGLTYKTTSPVGSGHNPAAGNQSITSDNQGRSSSTLQGSKVFRTRPSASSGTKGGTPDGGVESTARSYERTLGGTIYKSSKPKR